MKLIQNKVVISFTKAYKELGLLMLLVGVAVLTFASLVYFAEKDTLEGFSGGGWTFLDSFWWGIMTLTTVGYDHKSPQTFMGKVCIDVTAEDLRLRPQK